MHRDLAGKAGTRIRDAEDFDKELGQFEHALADSDDAFVGIDVLEEDPAHGRAGGGWADDPLVTFECVTELVDYAACFLPVP